VPRRPPGAGPGVPSLVGVRPDGRRRIRAVIRAAAG
jgi:hypothetical protein